MGVGVSKKKPGNAVECRLSACQVSPEHFNSHVRVSNCSSSKEKAQIPILPRTHLYAFLMSSADAPFSKPRALYKLSPALDSLRCGRFWSSMVYELNTLDISETLPVKFQGREV